jgi:hypothetical protein
VSGSTNILGALPIGGINVAAAASLGLVAPLFAELDLMLFGAFGLGSVQADLSLQFQTSLDIELGLALTISDPFAGIAALANLLASLQISLPTISLDISAAIAANISLQAALAIRLGGITALIEAMLAIKLPAVSFFAKLAAALSAGPVFLMNFEYDTPSGGLAGAGGAIAAQFAAGVSSGASSIAPFEPVYGIILFTKEPTVFASLGAVLKIA